jgi:hypothetical protein
LRSPKQANGKQQNPCCGSRLESKLAGLQPSLEDLIGRPEGCLFAFRIAIPECMQLYFSVQEEHDGPRVEKEKPIGKNSYLWRAHRCPICRCLFKCGHHLASFCKGRSLRGTANWGGFRIFVRTRSFCREFMVTSGHRSDYKAARKTDSGPGSSSDSESPASPALERLIFL